MRSERSNRTIRPSPPSRPSPTRARRWKPGSRRSGTSAPAITSRSSVARAIKAGIIPGPRTLNAGLAICMPGGHAWFIGRQADGPAEVVQAAREQIRAGADVIKFIATGGVLTPGTSPGAAQFTLEELRVGVEEATRAGRRVAAHAHGAEGMKNALRAGVHSIEHGTLLDDEALDLFLERQAFLVPTRSEEHTSELQSLAYLVCRLLLEKKKNNRHMIRLDT